MSILKLKFLMGRDLWLSLFLSLPLCLHVSEQMPVCEPISMMSGKQNYLSPSYFLQLIADTILYNWATQEV